jgi:tRNA(Ile)-lysidine synthase
LFAPWSQAATIVLAVSGGPDSMALLHLAAKWRGKRKGNRQQGGSQKGGHGLLAVTIDHGLRAASAREARQVKRAASVLGVPHRTLRWTSAKPKTGIQAAAREARYRLMMQAAAKAGAAVIFTAHTRDDQAETLLMRMARGSGLAGLAGMARQTWRGDVAIARPLLDIDKARLIATLQRAGIGWAEDDSNADPRFTRVRWRGLMPLLAREGLDSRNLGRLAGRLARANAALEQAADAVESAVVRPDPALRGGVLLQAEPFRALAEDIRLRLLNRAIDRTGTEGPAELGKVETLLAVLDRHLKSRGRKRLRRTLAGAMVSVEGDVLRIGPAPSRRRVRKP